MIETYPTHDITPPILSDEQHDVIFRVIKSKADKFHSLSYTQQYATLMGKANAMTK